VLDTGLRADWGRGLAEHPSLRAEVVGEAKEPLLVGNIEPRPILLVSS
jgi:hypothetical protein